MKKMMLTLIAVFAIAMSSKAMSYEQARNEALFLTDKMAYELNLTDAQYEAAYEINLDYLMSVSSRHDVFGPYWDRRNLDLQYILYSWQWEALRAASYFYRPLYWDAGYWHFGVYARYPHRNYFYFGRPHFYATYRGGHSWRLNGGRSYYEHHRHHYSPSIAREHHSGMRDGWNRGNYRTQHGHNSSTRITGSRNHDHNRPMGVGNAASGNNNTRHGEAGHSESAGHDNNRPFGAGNAATGSSTTSRSENSRISTTGVPNHNQSNRNLRNHNMQNRSAASQMQRSSGFSSPSRSAGVSSPTRSAGVSSPTRSAGVSSPTRSAGMSTSGSRSSVSSHSSSHSSGGATRGGGGGRSGGRR